MSCQILNDRNAYKLKLKQEINENTDDKNLVLWNLQENTHKWKNIMKK